MEVVAVNNGNLLFTYIIHYSKLIISKVITLNFQPCELGIILPPF